MVCFPQVRAPEELSLFTCVVSAVLAIVTIIGNTSIVAAVIKDPLKKLHTPFNYFLVNLAVSDLIIGVITMPISTYVHYTEYTDTLEMVWVKTLHMSYFISATSSLLSLIALSLDRLIAITYAINYKRYMRFRRCLLVSVGIWIISLSIPFIYFEWNYIGYLMLFAHSAIIVGLAIMAVVHARVTKYIKAQSKTMIRNISKSAPAKSTESYELKELMFQKKVTRTFLIILGVFIGVYIPAVIMIYILHFCESCDCTFRHVLRDLQFLLISSNSCMNPFIYTLRVKSFRQSLKIMFCKQSHFNVQNTYQSSTEITLESVTSD